MKFYFQLEFPIPKGKEEKLETFLINNDVNTILEINRIITIAFQQNEKKKLETLKINLLRSGLIKEKELNVEIIASHNWNKEWEKTIDPVFIKDKIIIYPSWKKNKIKRFKNRILIEIDPKMSFGTGHNETTQLILEMMCDYIDRNDVKMLDYGCGTGILAIAGIKLGIRKAIAIDIDKDSIMNAKEYIRNNNTETYITLKKCDINKISQKIFDVITANINYTIITRNIKLIKDKLSNYGKLFITGILQDEERDIFRVLYKNQFTILEVRRKAEWISIIAVNKQ